MYNTRKLFSINRKKGKATNPNNSFFSEEKKEHCSGGIRTNDTLLARTDALTTEPLRQPNGWVESKVYKGHNPDLINR